MQECLGGLRAGDAVLAVDDEERHAAGAQHPGFVEVGAHRVGVLVAGQHGAHPGLVRAGLGEQAGQGVVVGQVGALGEVRAEQPFLGRVADAEVGGQVQQPVRVQRVHGERGAEVEVQALGLGEFGHPGGHRRRLRAEPPGQVVQRRHRGAGRGVRVQLEAPPGDLDLACVLELAEGALQPALADVAPGADDVGPDLDLHDCAVSGSGAAGAGSSQTPSAQRDASWSPRTIRGGEGGVASVRFISPGSTGRPGRLVP